MVWDITKCIDCEREIRRTERIGNSIVSWDRCEQCVAKPPEQRKYMMSSLDKSMPDALYSVNAEQTEIYGTCGTYGFTVSCADGTSYGRVRSLVEIRKCGKYAEEYCTFELYHRRRPEDGFEFLGEVLTTACAIMWSATRADRLKAIAGITHLTGETIADVAEVRRKLEHEHQG